MAVSPARELVRGPQHPALHAAIVDALATQRLDAPPLGLVVPQRALGEALLRAAARRHGCIAGVRVLTWTELALLVTAEERRGERRLLGAEARTWLVRQLHPARGRSPGCFDSLLEVRGIRTALLRAFEELGRAGLSSAAAVERAVAAHGFDLPLQTRHALELYHAYRTSFESSHDDRASLLARAARAPAGRTVALLGGTRLFVYGFDSLEGVERRLLAHLAEDPDLDLTLYVPDAEPADRAFLEWLDQAGFRASPSLPAAAPAEVALRILAVGGDEALADEIVREILVAVDEGIRFDSTAVVVRSPRRLEILRAALTRRAIPFVQHPGASLAGGRTTRALLAGLDLAAAGLVPERVLDFLTVAPLRPGWAGVGADPVPSTWERVAREAALGTGIENWRRKFERYRQEREEEAERKEAEAEPSARPRSAARAASELLALAVALDELMLAFPERATWGVFVQIVAGWLDDVFAPGPEADALRRALESLGQLDLLTAFGSVSRGEFREALRTLVGEAAGPESERPGRGAVHLGTATALPAVAYDLVCLAGVQEGEWPSGVLEDPVLLPRDREALCAALGVDFVLRARADAQARERRLFAIWCGAARRRLVAAYARFDPVNGAPRLPSVLLLELVEQRTGKRFGYEDFEASPFVERIPLRHTALAGEPLVLGVDEIDTRVVLSLPQPLARRYVQGLGLCARRGLALDRLRNQWKKFTSVDGLLAAPSARAALARHLARKSFSATQLSTYAICPFRYFLYHVLRVEPLEPVAPEDVDEREVGKLVHSILERFCAERAAAGEQAARASRPERATRLEAAITSEVAAATTAGRIALGLLWEIRIQQLREDLRRYLEIEAQQDDGAWEPAHFELHFGLGTDRVTVLDRAGRAIPLHGRIDRVDRATRTLGLRVIDYKTGKPVARRDDPRAVQLALYLFAVTGGDPERLRASEARFVHVTRRGRFVVQRLLGSTLAERRAELERFVTTVANGIAAGHFYPQPGDHGRNCEFCDYKSVCEAGVVQQSERKAAAAQDVGWRALPDFAAHLEPPAAPLGHAPGRGNE